MVNFTPKYKSPGEGKPKSPGLRKNKAKILDLPTGEKLENQSRWALNDSFFYDPLIEAHN